MPVWGLYVSKKAKEKIVTGRVHRVHHGESSFVCVIFCVIVCLAGIASQLIKLDEVDR